MNTSALHGNNQTFQQEPDSVSTHEAFLWIGWDLQSPLDSNMAASSV